MILKIWCLSRINIYIYHCNVTSVSGKTAKVCWGAKSGKWLMSLLVCTNVPLLYTAEIIVKDWLTCDVYCFFWKYASGYIVSRGVRFNFCFSIRRKRENQYYQIAIIIELQQIRIGTKAYCSNPTTYTLYRNACQYMDKIILIFLQLMFAF